MEWCVCVCVCVCEAGEVLKRYEMAGMGDLVTGCEG